MLILPLAAVIPAYQALVAFDFNYSPLKVDGNRVAIYLGAYTPTLLILYIQALFGFFNPNEDLELQRQRRVRGQELDREMGIVYKPSWWRRINGENLDPNMSMRDRLAQNVREIHGNKPRAPNTEEGLDLPVGNPPDPVEMTPVSPPPPAASRMTSPRTELSPNVPLPEGATAAQRVAASPRREELMMDGPPPPSYRDTVEIGRSNVARSISGQSSVSTNQPPQQIRSMLDV
jgi:hypothetical protein